MNNTNITNLIIIGLLIILIVVSLLNKNRCDKIEGLSDIDVDSEALQNMASIYNKKNLTVENLNVTNAFNMIPKGVIVEHSKISWS